MPTFVKDADGFPYNFNLLTNDQQRFIMDLYIIERTMVKQELLETIKEMKELMNDI